jgi:hypothetical protein
MIRASVTLIIALAVAVAASADLPDARSWLTPPLAVSVNAVTPIPDSDTCEVVASKLISALVALTKEQIVPLDAATASYYVGACARPEPGKTFYLVRAIYGQGATGRFSALRLGDDLLIKHGSLARTETYTKTALVLDLPFAPKRLVVTASIAK